MVMAHMGEEDEKRREREKVRETVKGRDRKKKKIPPHRPVCNETYVLRWREMCVHASVNCVFEMTVYLILHFSV